jgi:hypothetical protein
MSIPMRETNSRVDIGAIFEAGTPIDDAVAAGIRAAVERHKLLGQPIVVWRDGKPTWLQPDEIELGPRITVVTPDVGLPIPDVTASPSQQ